MERLKAASESWQAALDERISKHPLPARPSPATTRPNNLTPASTDKDYHAFLKTPSAEFLAAEAIWRHLPPRQLWSQFQAIAWGLHGEVDRLAFHGALGGRDDIVYMLFQGSDFAGGDAGALCTGVHEDGTVARPFAVIGISQEVRTLCTCACMLCMLGGQHVVLSRTVCYICGCVCVMWWRGRACLLFPMLLSCMRPGGCSSDNDGVCAIGVVRLVAIGCGLPMLTFVHIH